MQPPALEFAFETHLEFAGRRFTGRYPSGERGITVLSGGLIEGPKLRGRVVPGGADLPHLWEGDVLQVEASYALESWDGHTIYLTNRGFRHGPPEVIDRIKAGEAVDPASYYFRTAAMLEAPVGSPYEWMSRSLFIGVGDRRPDNRSLIRYFQVL